MTPHAEKMNLHLQMTFAIDYTIATRVQQQQQQKIGHGKLGVLSNGFILLAFFVGRGGINTKISTHLFNDQIILRLQTLTRIRPQKESVVLFVSMCV